MYNSHTLQTRGYILLLSLIFLGIFFVIASAYVSSITSSLKNARYAVQSTAALSLAEAGIDKAAYELNQNPSYTGETDTPLGGGTFTVTTATIDSGTKRITAVGYIPNRLNPIVKKTVVANVGLGDATVAFHYGIQSGEGGFTLSNSSKIIGNVFSGGAVIGSGGNYIYGDVVSSGPSGLVYGIHATSSVYAHTIGSAGVATVVDKNAYYTTKTNTTVSGTSYPGSVDQDAVPLPISDAQISDWENQAEAGGLATCSSGTYQISSGSVTIGPLKIPCNFVVSGSAVVTVAGHIWVTGNITIQNSSLIKMSPSLGATNVAIIADNPADQLTGSLVSVRNTASFQNSGTSGSYVFLISQNKSAENGGSVTAIDLGNSASALVAYAAHGLIPLANSVSLKEATAYKITLQNTASVTYDTGLPSAVFESGPGGSWVFDRGSYVIVP
ncbi:MAG: hypothetical protein JWN18_316 [Parcubacteria group bacterium]|nr:hypothetical protein [Parcubacteria group bacterium]